MRMLRSCVIVVGLVPGLAAAQNAPAAEWPLDSGSKVRILSAVLGDRFQSGTLISTRADTLLFRPAGGLTPFTITTPNIVKLEVARGHHQKKAKGALIGLLVGAAGGAASAAASYRPCNDFCILDFGRGGTAAIGGALGGISGALIGTLVGALVGADTWVPVAVPR